MKNKLLLIFICLVQNVMALQRIEVLPDNEVTITVSKSHANVLRLQPSRIEAFSVPKHVSVEYEQQTNEVIFKLNSDEPVYGSILSESGSRYPIKLIPADLPLETIILFAKSEQPFVFETSQPYTKTLAELLKAMYLQEPTDGYHIEPIHQKVSFKQYKLLHTIGYIANGLSGEVFELKNNTVEPIHLRETDFYQPSVRAVAITNKQLLPGESTRIFVLRGTK